jgi:hypothetical protein
MSSTPSSTAQPERCLSTLLVASKAG